jgi:signal transduction histidine kinase
VEVFDFPRIMVDPELMKRVFSNIILNAIQAMPGGGQLTVKASEA